MAKDPAFLFYSSDFLTGTMFMSNEQIGIYIKLLCSQHQHGGLIDKTTFNNLAGEHQILRSKFVESEDGFYNERLALEVEKRNIKSSNMSDTAKKVWAERKIQKQYKSNTNVKENNANVKEKETFVMQPENENKDLLNNKKSVPKNLVETFFSDFPNSTELEAISRDLKLDKQNLITKLPNFRKSAELSYPNFQAFATHFKRWVNKTLKETPLNQNTTFNFQMGKRL